MNAEDASQAALLLSLAAGGDMEAWGALLACHQERLVDVITFRLDPRLRGRIDAADVMQETFIAATARRGRCRSGGAAGQLLDQCASRVIAADRSVMGEAGMHFALGVTHLRA